MLGVAEECIYLTEGGEMASCRGADEAKLLAIVFDYGFGGGKTMFSDHEV